MPQDVIGIARRPTASLPRRQRRELVQLVAAGGLSVLFFVAPMVLTQTGSPPPPGAAAAAPAESVETVRVVRTTVPVETSVPRFAPVAPTAKTPRRATARRPEGARTASADPRPRLVRRLARLFAGDGRHDIQPFPTVPSANR